MATRRIAVDTLSLNRRLSRDPHEHFALNGNILVGDIGVVVYQEGLFLRGQVVYARKVFFVQ